MSMRFGVIGTSLAALLLLGGCGGGGGGGDPHWYYHFRCNGDSACLSTNFAGATEGTSDQGPGQGGQSGCNSLMNFGRINWNIPPAEQSCDNSATIAPAPAPVITLTLGSTGIEVGQSTSLTWSTSNTTACTASDAWSGGKALNGSTSVAPSTGGTYTYTLSCTGFGGSASKSVVLTVNAPTISISLSPSTITDGGSSTLTWSSSRTASCTASGVWSGAVALSGSQPVAPSTGSYTYTLNCTGTGGAPVSGSATLTVNPSAARQAEPTVTISVSPGTISNGGSATLTWSSSHATSCTANGGWSGDQPLSGSLLRSGLGAGHYEFALSCNGSGGSASATAVLTVQSSGTIICSPPSASLDISPTSIVEGSSATLTWSAAKDPYCNVPIFSCSATGAWDGPVAANGTLNVAPSAGTFTYQLSCTGRNATVSRQVTLTVSPGTPPTPSVTMSFSPPGINLGDTSTLSWSASGVRSCTAGGNWSGAVALSGTRAFTPTAAGSYDYTLNCLGSTASASATATLSVEPAAGTTATARFNYPYHLTVDGSGNIFVTDPNSHAIRKIAADGTVTVFAGLVGTVGSADGTGANARFNYPYGIARDAAGTIYVADTVNNALRQATQAAAVGTLTSGSAGFNHPYGLAVDANGNSIVADTENHVVQKVTPAGVASVLAGQLGAPGSGDGTGTGASFNQPRDIAIDGSGNIYVADSLNNSIRKIVGNVVSTLVTGLDNPTGVACDSGGNVYVADSNASVVFKVTPAGVLTTFAGSFGNPGSANGNGTSAQFKAPNGVATDGADNVYVADTFNCTIRKITPAGDVTTLAGVAGDCRASN